jgi:hypothetical protein
MVKKQMIDFEKGEAIGLGKAEKCYRVVGKELNPVKRQSSNPTDTLSSAGLIFWRPQPMNPLGELQKMLLKHRTEVGGSYFVDVSFAAVCCR